MIGQNKSIEFTLIQKVAKGTKNNAVEKVSLNQDSSVWFRKTITFNHKAVQEVLAQEFFRLIMPHHPISFVNFSGHQQFIFTKEVENFTSLPKLTDNIIYSMFGEVLLCAMFFQEIDLNLDNIGLDSSNRVTKIDSEKCFSQVIGFQDDPFKLTDYSIARLPYLNMAVTYATNWLDLIEKGKAKLNSIIVDDSFFTKDEFIDEKNNAILKICLLPDNYIENFVNRYSFGLSINNSIIDLVKTRKAMLTEVALKNEDFINYMRTDRSNIVNNFINHLQLFCPYEEQAIIQSSNHDPLKQEVLNLFNQLIPKEELIESSTHDQTQQNVQDSLIELPSSNLETIVHLDNESLSNHENSQCCGIS